MIKLTFLFLSILFSYSGFAEDGQEKEETHISIEEYLQKLSTVQSVMARRDPFIKSGPPFQPPPPPEADKINMAAPVLERYPSDKYGVVATLLGDRYPRALVRLPTEEKSRVLIVKEKDKMGNKGGIISKILKDGIVVSESRKSPLGKLEAKEVVIQVGGAK